MMYEESYEAIRKLRILELSILFQHLRLGKEHLKKTLNKKQFIDLTQFNGLSRDQKNIMLPVQAEKSGNFALALNTVFTCVIGAWLGLMGFIESGLGSKFILLTITFLATISSACLGYYSYKSITQKAKDAITQQKLHNFQLNLVKMIIKKRRYQIRKNIEYLNNACQQLSEDRYDIPHTDEKFNQKFKSKLEIINWLNQLNELLEKKANNLPGEMIYQLYLEELADCKIHLKNLVSKNIAFKEETKKITQPISPAKKKIRSGVLKLKENDDDRSFLKVLTDPTMALPAVIPKKKSWLRTNLVSLLVGFLPTVFGGFGSMFVYFGGIPAIAKEMGVASLEIIVKHPSMKPIELLAALIITCYFGFIFLVSNYKTFLREQEIKQTEKRIANQETRMIEVNAKLNLLRKIRLQVVRILRIFHILKEISSAIHEKSKLLELYNEKIKS